MQLIDTFVRDDFGKEYCLILLKGKKMSFIQTSVGWSDDACGSMFQLTVGGGNGLLDFFFYIHKFSFCFDLIRYNWLRNYAGVSEEE